MAGSPPLRSSSFYGDSSSQSPAATTVIRSAKTKQVARAKMPKSSRPESARSASRDAGRRLSARWKSARAVPRAPTKSAQTETQGFLALSFPLFRPFKVCSASWRGGRRGRRAARGCSSAGRAPALHAGGHRFESGHLHQNLVNRIGRFEILVDCRGERLDSSC